MPAAITLETGAETPRAGTAATKPAMASRKTDMGTVTPMPEVQTTTPGGGEGGEGGASSPLFPELALAAESQWMFTEDELHLTPSVLSGLSMKQERQNRAKGVNFILQVGILLKLPQITLATAATFLHRFFMRHSMIKDPSKQRAAADFHYYSVAAASVWLAAKVEENCRKMKEVVVACVRVAQKDSNKVVDEQDKEYWRWRDTIIALEDKLLEGLCFDLSLESPYKALYDIICRFDVQDNKVFRNAAWAFVNDSCFAPLCVLFPSRTIAAASVYAAARSCKLDFLDEDGRPWWDIIGVPLAEIRKACNYMADVYQDAPLREGARQDLYQRTPVSGDERTAKTRAPQHQHHPSLSIRSDDGRGVGGGDGSFSREGSAMSNEDSETSRKRDRTDENENDDSTVEDRGQQPVSMNDVPWGGESPREREVKRVKQEAASNGFSDLREAAPGETAAVDKMQVDDDDNKRSDRRKHRKANGAAATVKTKPEPATGDQQLGAVSPDLGGSEEGELDE